MSECKRKENAFQRMETVDVFAGGVAHDLNNILAGLLGYPQLLLMDMPEDNPMRKTILAIEKSGNKIAAFAKDLSYLAGKGDDVFQTTNLNQIISEYLKSPEYENLRSYCDGLQVETSLQRSLPDISCSPSRLSNVVISLVSNAASAILEEGKIFLSTENRYVDIPINGYDCIKEGDYIVLTVSDTGTEMSLEDMRRIFEPFYARKTMKRNVTGLGLAMVWKTVKDHGGYIDVQSGEKRGTTFTLYFPANK